jgi:hypothetical protein
MIISELYGCDVFNLLLERCSSRCKFLNDSSWMRNVSLKTVAAWYLLRRLLLCTADQKVCLPLTLYANTYSYRPYFVFYDRFLVWFSQRNESVWVNRGLAPFVLSLGARWRRVVSFTPWQLYPKGKSPLPLLPGDRCVGLTTLPPSCADCLEIWEPQPPGTLRVCPGLWWDRFTGIYVAYFATLNCSILRYLTVFVIAFRIVKFRMYSSENLKYGSKTILCHHGVA